MQFVPKVEAFKNLDTLTSLLSTNGIQGFRPWRNDGYKWISFSDYSVFGEAGKNGLKNNLAYYISSDVAEVAQEVKLVLNINNIDSYKEALETFTRLALKTFSLLAIDSPQNLLINITKGEEFKYDNEKYAAELKILKTRVNSWSLTIRSK